MANFWAGFGQGFQGGFRKAYDRAARRRDIKEAREQARADEREVLEAEADAYRELTAQLRGELQGEQDKGESATITDPHDPRLSIMANRPEMPVFDMAGDESPLSRSELLKRKITGKANYSNLAKQISDIKAQNLAEKVRRQALADKQDQRDWDKLMRDDLWGREDEQEVAKRTSDQYFSLGRSFAYNGGERPDVPPKFLPDFDRGVASVEADKGKVDYGAEVDARAAQKAKDIANQEAFNNKLAEHNYWVKRLNQIDPTLANQFAIKETPDGNRTIGEWRKEGEIPVPLSAAQLSAAVNEMSAIVKSRGERTDERMDGLDEELSKLDMFLPNDLMLPRNPAEMQNLVTLAKLRKETYDAVRAYPSATGRMGLPKPSLTQIVNMENPDDLIRLTRDYEVLTRQKNDADELAKKVAEAKATAPFKGSTPASVIQVADRKRQLREQLSTEKDPTKRKLIQQQLDDLSDGGGHTITLPGGTVVRTGGGGKSGGGGKQEMMGEGLSSSEIDALNKAKQTIFQADKFMDEFGDDGAKNLNLWRKGEHILRNVAFPSIGINDWEDPRMAAWHAQADSLSAKAMAATHKMHGGGMMSQADVALYSKAVPTTDTYSPAEYQAKFQAWRDRIEGLVNYQEARQKMGNLPKFMSELTPAQALSLAGKKVPETGRVVLAHSDVEFLAENVLSWRYVDGDIRNPVTFEHIKSLMNNGELSKEDATSWILYANIPYPKK